MVHDRFLVCFGISLYKSNIGCCLHAVDIFSLRQL